PRTQNVSEQLLEIHRKLLKISHFMGSTGAYRALRKFGSIGVRPLALQDDDLDGDTGAINILHRLKSPTAPDLNPVVQLSHLRSPLLTEAAAGHFRSGQP
ncbi:hypothetical protein, partial [Novosphingobium naphthalenivorans]|uniref:hypothetical protein n=1 Tax=Novosphingobium naphthalenivorans TaxID=273168 RepID=UPI001C3F3EDF